MLLLESFGGTLTETFLCFFLQFFFMTYHSLQKSAKVEQAPMAGPGVLYSAKYLFIPPYFVLWPYYTPKNSYFRAEMTQLTRKKLF